MDRDELFLFRTCMENGCTADQAKSICQVYNTDRKRESRRKEQIRRYMTSMVPISSFPEYGGMSGQSGFVSPDPGPEEKLMRKEEISFLKYLIELQPEKYRSFIKAAFDNDCVGIFEEKRSEKYREVDKLARILGISSRSVRRYVIRIKKSLYEKGKYMLADAIF